MHSPFSSECCVSCPDVLLEMGCADDFKVIAEEICVICNAIGVSFRVIQRIIHL